MGMAGYAGEVLKGVKGPKERGALLNSFDSLGSKHPQRVQKGGFLHLEARLCELGDGA